MGADYSHTSQFGGMMAGAALDNVKAPAPVRTFDGIAEAKGRLLSLIAQVSMMNDRVDPARNEQCCADATKPAQPSYASNLRELHQAISELENELSLLATHI